MKQSQTHLSREKSGQRTNDRQGNKGDMNRRAILILASWALSKQRVMWSRPDLR